jgi:branched-chain amino acid transport system ATP-binding protein
MTDIPAAPLIDVQDLHVSYGAIDAVQGVSLHVHPGEIVTLIGPNGAGKTTLLSALMGVLPARGRILLDGTHALSVDGAIEAPIDQRVRAGLSLVPETRALFASMSVEDNLLLGAFRHHREPRAAHARSLEAVFDRFPRLKERRRQEAASLSGGERQMLAIGRALMGRPRLLILDEPSLGLAPLIVKDIFRIVDGLRQAGVSILLVEQNARAALKLADRAYVLELGRITVEGPAAALAQDPRIAAAYLGPTGQTQAA